MAKREPTPAGKLLVVDDDLPFRRSLAISLRLDGIEVLEAGNRAEALAALGLGGVGLALVNQHLDADGGEALMEEIARLSPSTRIAAVSYQPGLRSTAVSSGRAQQLVKPISLDAVRKLLAG